LRGLSRRLGHAAGAILLHPGLGLGRRPIVDNEIVTTLLQNVAGHGIAHHAEPDPCNLRHLASPWVLLVRLSEGSSPYGARCQVRGAAGPAVQEKREHEA